MVATAGRRRLGVLLQQGGANLLLLEPLHLGRQVGVLHVQILDEDVVAGEPFGLVGDHDALRFQSVAHFGDFTALVLPDSC